MQTSTQLSRSSSSSNLYAWSSSLTKSLINMLTFNDDITHEIFFYLPLIDILHSRQTCQYLNKSLSTIWRRLLWRDIVPIQFLEEIHSKVFTSMGEEAFFTHVAGILGLDGGSEVYSGLYKTFYIFKKPLLGYYRRTAFHPRELRGALDVIYISSNQLVYQTYVIYNNELITYDPIPWTVKDAFLVNDTQRSILGGPMDSLPSSAIGTRKSLSDIRIWFDTQSRITSHNRLNPHVLSSTSLKPLPSSLFDLFQSCLGLFKGMYGEYTFFS